MGTYFGWSCMSWRHPARVNASSMRATAFSRRCFPSAAKALVVPARSAGLKACSTRSWRHWLMRHLLHALHALELQQEVGGVVPLELRVGGFDDEEEMVAACHGEPAHVEDGVVGHGQAVEREHTEDGGGGGGEHRAFEGDGNKG